MKPKDTEMTPTVDAEALGIDSHKHGEQRSTCPECGVNLMRTAIIKIAYTYQSCDCRAAPYVHLVEQLWHREHVR